ncbi:MAG TPA: GNAT family N-acetyltransferase [Pirellulaceae bacterium]|nr:GNAT family N-acetyltransferase [Pirellulaceae bacterium]
MFITLETKIPDSFRVQQVLGMFDLPERSAGRVELAVELPPKEERWTIGAIVGPSGSGKTTAARAGFGMPSPAPHWPADRPVIDAFGGLSLRQTLALLSAVGFNSPPAWLRPHNVLSSGEQFRCDLARRLDECGPLAPRVGGHSQSESPTLVLDEFTAHLDRDTARSCSFALQRFLRGAGVAPANGLDRLETCPTRFVAVTGHDDVIPWLAPDWVLRMPAGKLDRGPFVTPPLPLRLTRADRSVWAHFRPHHYLSGQLARGATCYVALWSGRPAAFCAVLGQIGHAGRKRITRLVTLPQFQGLGIGMRLAEYVCRLEAERGFRVSIATSHPAVIASCRRSPRWKYLGIKRCGGTPQCIRGRRLAGSTGRIVAAFEFSAECGVRNAEYESVGIQALSAAAIRNRRSIPHSALTP